MKALDQTDEGRLASPGRSDNSDALPRLDREADVPQGPGPALVLEVHVIEGDRPLWAIEVDRVGCVDDVRLGIKQHEGPLKVDQLLLHRTDRRTNCFEWGVNGRDVRQENEELADRQLPVQYVKGTNPEDQSRARCSPRVDDEREKGLPDGEADSSFGGGLALGTKAAELVALTSEGRDDPHHCHCLEHNRQGLPFKPTNLLDPWHDPSGVYANRVIHDRDYRQSEQGKNRVEVDRDHEHRHEPDQTLHET